MAFLEVKNVRIAGISAGVPKHFIDNLNSDIQISEEYDNAQFVKNTGVKKRHLDENLTTSDLCYPAAIRLLNDLGWDPKEIDAIIFVSQFFDFIAPATACIIQDKLGCSKECLAYDIELGCSGWIYGMASLSSLMQGGFIKKALLLAGDGRWNYEGAIKYSDALFGHAGTVTALIYEEGATGFKFHLGSDGSGYKALWVPEGGARNPINPKSLEEFVVNGERVTGLTTRMNGMDVFSFGITTAPKSIKRLSEKFNVDFLDRDYFVFHQANLQMNQMIAKKLKLPKEKIPYSMTEYGNTSSASIPLTMVTQISNDLRTKVCKLLCCGFGIGLSWGTLYVTTDKIIVSELVEVESNEHMLQSIQSGE